MKKIATLVAGSLALAAALVPSARAADPLGELLEQTRNFRALEAEKNAEREKRFIAERDQQQRLLEEARAERDAALARSKEVSAAFDANEIQLNELETLLDAREGNLGELFGVTRQVAGDLSAVVYNSLISAQYPGRDVFFSGIAKSKSSPTAADLEKLWFEIQREMTETGRVTRWSAPIVTAQGASETTEVVRVGPFIAMAGDRYLSFQPGVNTLTALARQPSGDLRDLAAGVGAAKEGYTRSIIDPSRGVLLALTVQRPGLWERIAHGEAVGYVILLVGALGSLCAIYQLIYLIRVRLAVRRQVAQLDRPTPDNPLGRVLAAFRSDPARIEEDAEVVELRISEAVLREVPALERFQSFLRLAVAAGPLLGLIGTVIGMIITFQSITESGSSDPKLMAHGISQAMIATVLGLGIAIPLLFANAGLASLSDAVVQVLDEQSTGILAEHIERQRAETAPATA